jgi:hypothetical protein
MAQSFPLASMSAPVRVMTLLLLLALPVLFLALAFLAEPALLLAVLLVGATYAWVWLWLRPSAFLVGEDGGLWTRRRGLVLLAVSRTDRFVWVETTPDSRPWLITPQRPELFVATLTAARPPRSAKASSRR